jgi:hypothetical protein
MKLPNNGLAASEPALVRLYMELTGASESVARDVFMLVCGREVEEQITPFQETAMAPRQREMPERSLLAGASTVTSAGVEGITIPVPA